MTDHTLEEPVIREGADGVGRLHERIADRVDEANQVVVGIETDRGCWLASWSRPATR